MKNEWLHDTHILETDNRVEKMSNMRIVNTGDLKALTSWRAEQISEHKTQVISWNHSLPEEQKNQDKVQRMKCICMICYKHSHSKGQNKCQNIKLEKSVGLTFWRTQKHMSEWNPSDQLEVLTFWRTQKEKNQRIINMYQLVALTV